MKRTETALEQMEKIDAIEAKEVEGPPPVVFHFKVDSHKVYETPAQLKLWEWMMKEAVGMRADLDNLVGTCTDSCSCCRSDDCDAD